MIYTAPGQVSTLAVEWIEIRLHHGQITVMVVSTLAVEWIEIHHYRITITSIWVSTLAVEWIEMLHLLEPVPTVSCLHPRGGVD